MASHFKVGAAREPGLSKLAVLLAIGSLFANRPYTKLRAGGCQPYKSRLRYAS